MRCSKVKKYINLIADNEITDADKIAAFKHIAGCKSCLSEYNKIVSAKYIVSSDPLLNELRSKNVTLDLLEHLESQGINPKQKNRMEWIYMKKRLAAICMIAILAACSFIPVNGKSLASTIGNMVSEISLTYTRNLPDDSTVNINNTVIVDKDSQLFREAVYGERDRAIREAQKITDPVEKQNKIDEAIQRANEKLENSTQNDINSLLAEYTITCYNSIDEAKSNIPIKFLAPKYVPENYVFEKIEYSRHNKGLQDMVKFIYKPVENSAIFGKTVQNSEGNYLSISYIIDNTYKIDSDTNEAALVEIFKENTDIEEISILNNPGYILKKAANDETSLFMSINTLCKEYRVSAGMMINTSNADVEKIKSELIKVQESFISQQ